MREHIIIKQKQDNSIIDMMQSFAKIWYYLPYKRL